MAFVLHILKTEELSVSLQSLDPKDSLNSSKFYVPLSDLTYVKLYIKTKNSLPKSIYKKIKAKNRRAVG